MKSRLKSPNGQVAVITALLIVAFVGMLALVTDMGSLYEDRRELHSVADASALAGVQELPEEPDTAAAKAIEYVQNNRPDITSIDIQIGSYLTVNDMITVTINNPNSPLYFGRIFGSNTANVGATATAVVGKPKGLSDLVPWGLELPEEEEGDIPGWLNGDPVKILKYGPGDAESGNFRALDLDHIIGGGANDYYPQIVDGYQGYLEVGDLIYTETGNMGKTGTKVYERIAEYGDGTLHPYGECVIDGELYINNGQFVMVPVIPKLEELPGGPTGLEEIPILAFVPFFITEIVEEGANKGEIIGQFVPKAKIVQSGGIDPVEESGFRVFRLIK
jgi:hypothetical protein